MRSIDGICCWIVSGLVVNALTMSGRAQEPDAEARLAETRSLTMAAAATYEFTLSTAEPRAPLTLHPESLLRWSNPTAGELYGNVFVWTQNGRPEVIASMYQWYSPHTHGGHEFHSLATTGLSTTREGEKVWTCTQPGVTLRPIPGSTGVADSTGARLRQLRDFARRFSVVKTDREKVSHDIRLLPQPVYRYPFGGKTILDGGLFLFVEGTDPEVILQVEARRVGDAWQWQYALARMNSVQFVARYENQEVWRVETLPWVRVTSRRESYTSFGKIVRPDSP